jgi:hypothetical protein
MRFDINGPGGNGKEKKGEMVGEPWVNPGSKKQKHWSRVLSFVISTVGLAQKQWGRVLSFVISTVGLENSPGDRAVVGPFACAGESSLPVFVLG